MGEGRQPRRGVADGVDPAVGRAQARVHLHPGTVGRDPRRFEVQTRNNLSELVANDVRANLGDVVYRTVIPRNVRLSEAPSYAVPATVYDPTSTGSLAYRALARELLERGTRSAA